MRNTKIINSTLILMFIITLSGCGNCGSASQTCPLDMQSAGNLVRLNYNCPTYNPAITDYNDSLGGYAYYAEIGGCYYKSINPAHIYTFAGTDEVHVEIIPIKNGGQSPLTPPVVTWEAQHNVTSFNSSIAPCFNFDGWKDSIFYGQNPILKTNFSYPPRCGDTVTYIVSFKACDSKVNKMEIRYDDVLLDFIEQRTGHITNADPSVTVNHTNTPGQPGSDSIGRNEFVMSNLVSGQYYNLFLSYYVDSNFCKAGVENRFRIVTELSGDSDTKCYAIDNTSRKILEAGKPFDPNFVVGNDTIALSSSGECNCSDSLLNYRVEFQNEGSGVANNVIIDLISPNINGCLFDEFTVTAYDDNGSVVVFSEVNTVIGTLINGKRITLNGLLLRGTKEKIAPQNSNATYGDIDPLTIGWIDFSIRLNSNCCYKNNETHIYADIYFDHELPVSTNLFTTYICPKGEIYKPTGDVSKPNVPREDVGKPLGNDSKPNAPREDEKHEGKLQDMKISPKYQ